MKNLKIRTKLLVTFMLVIILFCGTVAIAIMGLNQNADKYSVSSPVKLSRQESSIQTAVSP